MEPISQQMYADPNAGMHQQVYAQAPQVAYAVPGAAESYHQAPVHYQAPVSMEPTYAAAPTVATHSITHAAPAAYTAAPAYAAAPAMEPTYVSPTVATHSIAHAAPTATYAAPQTYAAPVMHDPYGMTAPVAMESTHVAAVDPHAAYAHAAFAAQTAYAAPPAAPTYAMPTAMHAEPVHQFAVQPQAHEMAPQMTYGAAPTMPMDHMQQPPAYTQAATHYDMSGGAGLHQAQSMLMHPGMTPQFQFTPSGVAEPVQQVAVAPAPAPAPAAVEMPAQQTPDAAEKKPTGKRDKKKAGKTKKTCC